MNCADDEEDDEGGEDQDDGEDRDDDHDEEASNLDEAPALEGTHHESKMEEVQAPPASPQS